MCATATGCCYYVAYVVVFAVAGVADVVDSAGADIVNIIRGIGASFAVVGAVTGAGELML